MRHGRVVDLVYAAPGFVAGFPDNMTFGVGQLARRAEVVGVVVENLRCACRWLGGFGQGVLEARGNAPL